MNFNDFFVISQSGAFSNLKPRNIKTAEHFTRYENVLPTPEKGSIDQNLPYITLNTIIHLQVFPIQPDIDQINVFFAFFSKQLGWVLRVISAGF